MGEFGGAAGKLPVESSVSEQDRRRIALKAFAALFKPQTEVTAQSPSPVEIVKMETPVVSPTASGVTTLDLAAPSGTPQTVEVAQEEAKFRTVAIGANGARFACPTCLGCTGAGIVVTRERNGKTHACACFPGLSSGVSPTLVVFPIGNKTRRPSTLPCRQHRNGEAVVTIKYCGRTGNQAERHYVHHRNFQKSRLADRESFTSIAHGKHFPGAEEVIVPREFLEGKACCKCRRRMLSTAKSFWYLGDGRLMHEDCGGEAALPSPVTIFAAEKFGATKQDVQVGMVLFEKSCLKCMMALAPTRRDLFVMSHDATDVYCPACAPGVHKQKMIPVLARIKEMLDFFVRPD